MMTKVLLILSIFANKPEEVFITPDLIIKRTEEISIDEKTGKIEEKEEPEFFYVILHRKRNELLLSSPANDRFEVKPYTQQAGKGWMAIPLSHSSVIEIPEKVGEEIIRLGSDSLYGESVDLFKIIRRYAYSKGNYEDNYRVAKAPFPAILKRYGIEEKELGFLFAGTEPFTQNTHLENGFFEPAVERYYGDKVFFTSRKIVSIEEVEMNLNFTDDLLKRAGWTN